MAFAARVILDFFSLGQLKSLGDAFFCFELTHPLLLLRERLFRGDNQRHDPAFHGRIPLNLAVMLSIDNELFQDFFPQINMLHLPAPEKHGDLNLILLLEEFKRVLQLGLVIMLVDIGLNPDLFQVDLPLVLLGFPLLLFLVILEFAEVYDPAYGRACLRRYLNEV